MSLEEQIAQTVDPTLFTRLCNSLFTAEHGHSYQVIDGTRGDVRACARCHFELKRLKVMA